MLKVPMTESELRSVIKKEAPVIQTTKRVRKITDLKKEIQHRQSGGRDPPVILAKSKRHPKEYPTYASPPSKMGSYGCTTLTAVEHNIYSNQARL
ncbi:hypothetical protein M8C21_001394 [Ambrosia artemisiifolia]|uniref:Uncharacterized protein n=1 Tax=Ambrosia artemisiifolia TaxID=4212 RepID=A0AAD5D952_AMBAR|nr:hypothetical protein M8C21_001394 [Ambrosia artemisiifolia]